jgi:hypothetical protein
MITPERRSDDGGTTGMSTAEAWPADGSAGICPGCGNPVFYTGEPGSYGVWFHDSGMEDCDE